MLSEIQQKIQDLQELNKDTQIPALQQFQTEIQEHFDKATASANKLESIMANFSDERENLQAAIEEETEWLNKMKDKLSKLDDVSGSDEDLVRRLQGCKVSTLFLPTHL